MAIGSWFGYYYWQQGTLISKPQNEVNQSQSQSSTLPFANSPTPMPFAGLTIPALRLKNYDGTLGERTLHSRNGTYTSYLTSYTSEGLKINAQLTIPTGDEPEGGWPAIVFIHGYIPPTQYTTLGKYVAYVDYLARNGFVVFKIDLRGHGDSEGESGGAYYSADYVIDALNARSALQTSGFVNPDKVGLWGHSMAGNVVTRSIAVKPEIPAAVIWAGAGYTYKDLVDYRISDSSYVPNQTANQNMQRRQRIRDTYGDPDLSKEFWQQMALITYLSELKTAIEIHHAVNDDVVSVQYARNLKTYLEKENVKHAIYEYPTGGHNIDGASFNTAMERTVAFFKENL